MLVECTLIGVLVLGLLLKYLTRRKYNLPPGPPGLPYIGNIHQLDKDKPHDTITKWSEKYGDIFRIKVLGKDTVVLNSFETIYEGLVTQANQFAGRTESYRLKAIISRCPDIVISTFSPQWVFTKKLTLQTLKMYGDNLTNLEALTMDLISDMLKELEMVSVKGPQDIYPIFHKCITGIITSILYGEKADDETVQSILKCALDAVTLIQPSGPYAILDQLPWLRYFPIQLNKNLTNTAESFRRVVSSKISERKEKHKPGHPMCFIDGLLESQRKSAETQAQMRLTDSEMYGISFDLFFAGTFTTSTTLNALLAVLVNKPKIQEKMVSEIKSELGDRPPRLADRKTLHYMEAAILEVLRYSSILTFSVPHSATVDTTINGYDIPKDTEVFFNLWKLHHHTEYWDEPWEFKPERFLDNEGIVVPPDHINRKRLLPFGASRRVCVGETLAKNRLFLMVTSLLQQFEFLPAGPDEIPRHDPRDYKNSFGVEPYRYRVRVVARQ